MQKSIGELGIGTFDNIATVCCIYSPLAIYYNMSTQRNNNNFLSQACENTPIIVALNTFHERRVSALPIIDAAGKQTSLNSSETLLFIPAVWVVLRVLCSFFYLLNVWFVCAGKAVDIYAKFDVIVSCRNYN